MPAELFRTVAVRRPTSGRKLGAVPLSIAFHVAVLVAAITIPLFATDVLPVPQIPLVMQVPPMPVVVVPTPPPTRAAMRATPQPAATEPGPPLVPPEGIREETLAHPQADIPTFTPGDLTGSVVGDARGIVEPPLPPPPPKVIEPVRPGGLVKMPTKIHVQPPVYPPMAVAARVQGTVVIEAIISTTGTVQDARVITSPSRLLDQAALDAVRQWVFTPTLLNGTAVPIILTVKVDFTLQ